MKSKTKILLRTLSLIVLIPVLNSCESNQSAPIKNTKIEPLKELEPKAKDTNNQKEIIADVSDDTKVEYLAKEKQNCKGIEIRIEKDYELNIDSLEKYSQLIAKKRECKDQNYKISTILQSDSLVYSVYLNRVEESHYSHNLALRCENSFNKKIIDEVTLSENYGNENYEKITTSKIKNNDMILVEILEYFGPRNGKGFMDENSKRIIKQNSYNLNGDNGLKLITSEEKKYNFEKEN